MGGWRRTKKSADDERRLLTQLITNDEFIRQISEILDIDLLTDYAQIIAKWCLDYYDAFAKAPGVTIQTIYADKQDTLTEDHANLIASLLHGLSEDFIKENTPYELDQAEKYLSKQALERTKRKIEAAIVSGNILEGEHAIAEHKQVRRPSVHFVNPFDSSVIIESLSQKERNGLFHLPGDLGKTIGPFCAGHLWAIVAPMKRGKTWWLLYLAQQAVFQGLNVLFLSYEMSTDELVFRFSQMFTKSADYSGTFLIPYFDCLNNQFGTCRKRPRNNPTVKTQTEKGTECVSPSEVPNYKTCISCMEDPGTIKEYKEAVWCRQEKYAVLSPKIVIDRAKALSAQYLRGNKIIFDGFPPKSMSLKEMEHHIDNMEHYHGFCPDVIITDYADKLRSDSKEYRHGINEIWEGHKAIAQARRCAMLTASQSNTARSGKDVGEGDWAEDIRKRAHLDGAFALNQTPEEQLLGIMRVVVTANRFHRFDLLNNITVLQQLDIGQPYLDSLNLRLTR